MLLTVAPAAFGLGAYPPEMAGTRVETYKTIGDVVLKLWIFEPEHHATTNRSPAVVCFFGGGWTSGSPAQFEQQCRHLASRGIVAITADYRVASRQHAKPVQCVADAKSAIRWVREHASQFGIDPDRIAAAGGSAGGHLAACTGTIKEFDETNENAKVSSVPNAMILFNPGLVLAPFGELKLEGFGTRVPAERLGTEPEKISPAHHIVAGTPPTVIFHGRSDTTIPFASAQAFADAMKKAGNRCELIGYDGQSHGFFNYKPGGNPFYDQTVAKMDEFLVSLGWLPPATH
jgi:acetyl esterase/lipase